MNATKVDLLASFWRACVFLNSLFNVAELCRSVSVRAKLDGDPTAID